MQLSSHRIDYHSAAITGDATALFGSDGISVGDVVDILNPLEHIPFVSTLYDNLTGSTPKAGAKIIGGALYGGPVGLIASAMNLAFRGETGQDMVGAMVAGITDVPTDSQVATASADTTEALQQLGNATSAAWAGAAQQAAAVEVIPQAAVAEILPPTRAAKPLAAHQAQAVLSLFDGAALAPTHQAYRKTQALGQTVASRTADLRM